MGILKKTTANQREQGLSPSSVSVLGQTRYPLVSGIFLTLVLGFLKQIHQITLDYTGRRFSKVQTFSQKVGTDSM